MNGFPGNEVDIAIIAGTAVFLLFAGFITIYIIIYWKRKLKHLEEVEKMKIAFNEEILKSQLEIQEQTFQTISREIHDNVGQTLSLAKVQVNIIDQGETMDRALLAELRQTIGKAMNDLRDLAKSINSEHIEFVSLKELITAEADRMQRSKVLTTTVIEVGTPTSIAHQRKLIMFRMVQESLQNVLKHANASSVTVHITHSSNVVQIKIVDNGQGFDPVKISKGDGLGLQNITNRATLIGGTASIKSSFDEGTTIILNCPYA